MNPAQSFDYVVIGGGSAGCVLASRLTEDPSVSVALLEAGEPDRSVLIHCPAGFAAIAKVRPRLNWAFETVPQPGLNGRRGYQPRGRTLGGSSSINAMIYIRGHRADYDGWAAEGNPGWSYDEVLPYFRRSENNERLDDDLHGRAGPLNTMDLRSPNRCSALFVQAGVQAGFPANPDFNGAQQEGVGMYQVSQRSGERCSAARAYLTPVLSRPNLSVFTRAHATRILTQGRRATGVAFVEGGTAREIGARREVLLCAGAFQSPQLLLLSGIGPAAQLQRHGIAVVHELAGVGRQLHDHADVVLVVDTPQVKDLFGLSLLGGWNVLRAIGQWRRERLGPLTTNFAEAGGFLRSGPDQPRPDLQLHFVIAKLVDHGRKTVLGHGYSCHVCLLLPDSRGSVELASADPMAAPLIDPNFLGDARDLERLVRGVALVRRILAQPALAALGGRELPALAAARSDDEVGRFVRDHADTIYHPVGSCRMGPRDTDVVDARLRVHGMQALRVVDASVMPRVVAGNTNAPVIMIAEKAADMIREDAR